MPEGVLVDAHLLREWRLPEPGSDKEERGRLLVVAGSRTTPGAGLLSAEAALRVGAGKVRLLTAAACAPTIAVAVPELMVTGLAEDADGNIDAGEADQVVDCAGDSHAILLGPGFSDPDGAADLVERIAPRLEGTVVIDALASAYVTQDPERVADLAATVVLTVNPGELARCLGADADDVQADLATHTVELARRTSAVVLCGGPTKVVAHGDDLWRVEAGNVGLGTAGSGDVQAGLVTGLVGRGADPAQAAVWGAFLHATVGDRLAARVGPVGYLARELAGEVPPLLAELAQRSERHD
ncbi:NAD(P)H-hydrate dehydratase [Nocardioides sp. S-58]|uniref:ADP-dependent (S)-NAD(P)H-hydrate dehydratase n=1 Tax=Nocardioides renjunii TaxID=3095075 RepID=A0ABU5KFI5_9ACTN|nr:NAD(P)H-hydrate dehydratase [Nocardioides sp. S-58]MDZ5663626.1 NAD(P)H-hydrate dehydratase [Nocardioides sp. S-58]